jgi:hypothetical protein
LFTCLAIGIILSVARNAEASEGNGKTIKQESEDEEEEIGGEAMPA